MSLRDVRLEDRFDLSVSPVLLSGTQALIRALLAQAARDASAGLSTAGFATGYRGSPLGGLDFQMLRAGNVLDRANIRFEPALNEDLAVTALWGSQQAELRGEGRYQGVFGLWYGKGPGVDRSGDAFRHANMAGTSKFGGVVAALGDDHTGESSTTLHHSELAMIDYGMPILAPAGVQEVFDGVLTGIAMSRFCGCWIGLKCVKETIEATSVIDGNPHRSALKPPQFDMPSGGLNIRLGDTPVEREALTLDVRRRAAQAFARANRMDHPVWNSPGARIGFAAAGKSWLDLLHAFHLLGIGRSEAERFGISSYKIAMPWPLDAQSFGDWCDGFDLVVLVEEKRKVIEPQAKDWLYNMNRRPGIIGERDQDGSELFPACFALEPIQIAIRIARILARQGCASESVIAAARRLESDNRSTLDADIVTRAPYFCSGCPHNRSTSIPEGSRAYAGIGCHYMVQWMNRDTEGFTHMGGEGANWIGEAPFSQRDHVFQNMGDGTYNHSGIQAIRAACAAKVNITFKLLFNDAVAMTGGQINDGGLTAARLAQEIAAFGVRRLVVIHDEKEQPLRDEYPKSAEFLLRAQLDAVQRELREVPGVSVIIYVQTCAAEKRRRRKRGSLADPDRHIFINSDVCEGCGDCGRQSNCLSIIPLDTPLGRKRAIDQSTCNKDYSCLLGFCPALVAVDGGKVRKGQAEQFAIPDIPEPCLRNQDKSCAIVISGVGGTGVVTIGAIISMAAHLDGLGVGMIEMAGLAQKGGAVQIHCRMAAQPSDIAAIRVANGEADCVIAGDLAVASSLSAASMLARGRTVAAVNSSEIITGDFVNDRNYVMPRERMIDRIGSLLESDDLLMLDAVSLARTRLGDSVYANMILLGAAWQKGALPLSHGAVLTAIELNGASAGPNKQAFEIGRWAATDLPGATGRASHGAAVDPVAYRRNHLMAYGGRRYADRFEAFICKFSGDPALYRQVADSYHSLLAAKDEFEVARLHLETTAQICSQFTGRFRVKFFLAPPILSRSGTGGRPGKLEFGRMALWMFRILARLRFLRETRFDPFAYTSERRLRRELIANYERDMVASLKAAKGPAREAVLELAALPTRIKGFGPVWQQNLVAADARRTDLLAAINGSSADG